MSSAVQFDQHHVRLCAFALLIAALGSTCFTVALGVYLESDHSGSGLRMAVRRIALELRENARMFEIANNVFREVANAFQWLNAAFLFALAASLALLVSSTLLFRWTRNRSTMRAE